MKNKYVHLGIIGIFCSLYFLVATISMINSVEFFDLAHHGLMNWALAIGFELGAAASLAAIVILEKTNKAMVWSLFLLLTTFQMMANSYHAFVNLEQFQGWIELFGLQNEELIFQKRVLSIVSGAVLPVVALGFIKSLTDYVKPENQEEIITSTPTGQNNFEAELQEAAKVVEVKDKHLDKIEKVIESTKKDTPNELFDGIRKKQVKRIQDKFATEGNDPSISDEGINPDIAKEIDPTNINQKSHTQSDTDIRDGKVVFPKSGELEVEIDEKTGTTFVKTKKNQPSLNNPTKSNPL